MAYELLVKERFTAQEKGDQRVIFRAGDIISDPDTIAKIEKSPWVHHVMRRAVPPHAPQPENPAQPEISKPAQPAAASEQE